MRRCRVPGERARQGNCVGAPPVHLPVAGDKLFSFGHFYSPAMGLQTACAPAGANVAAAPGHVYVSALRSHRDSPRSTDRAARQIEHVAP
jgi:hypothetical protein